MAIQIHHHQLASAAACWIMGMAEAMGMAMMKAEAMVELMALMELMALVSEFSFL